MDNKSCKQRTVISSGEDGAQIKVKDGDMFLNEGRATYVSNIQGTWIMYMFKLQ